MTSLRSTQNPRNLKLFVVKLKQLRRGGGKGGYKEKHISKSLHNAGFLYMSSYCVKGNLQTHFYA